ncbi:MAG: cytochrome c oxidase subunit II [Actinobacteria bacterium]|uniref:cytochrome-c oxidase n=2 Tax=freshwater metagenome TaxID=449393 RepID=A0A6J7CFJ9_9ZZZZ|nr:cytochrome c oxidase subunit II [Actinomycetota bacterium]
MSKTEPGNVVDYKHSNTDVERFPVPKIFLRLIAAGAAIAAALTLSGCTAQELRGFLPSEAGVTNQTSRIIGLWSTSWLVLLVVGAITWGLIIWAALAYRRRKTDTGLPSQLRYNTPIETFFTIVPLILVLGFFAFTARDQAIIEAVNPNPDVKIEVFGKRWAWDFNYLSEDVHFSGVQAREKPDNTVDINSLPILYLPVGKSVEISIESRDVNHSFWILDFLYKKDMIPGKTNHWYVTPEKEGTYRGKCAELCGEYHSLMLFTVKVVSQAEYDAQMQKLRDQDMTGRLGPEYNANNNLPGTDGNTDS